MRTGRPIPVLSLTEAEQETLQNWARRPKSAQALALRARIVLRCAEGMTNTAVARQVQVRSQTVGKWRQRFVDRRLDGLLDEPRPGTPRKVSDADVERRAHDDAGIDAEGCHALEHPILGQASRPEPEHRRPHLARLRTTTAPQRNVQAIQRPAVHR